MMDLVVIDGGGDPRDGVWYSLGTSASAVGA